MKLKTKILLLIPRMDDGGVERLVANIANYVLSKNSNEFIDVFVFSIRKGNGRGLQFYNEKSCIIKSYFDLLKLFISDRKNLKIYSALTPANFFALFISIIFGIRFIPSQHCVVYQQNKAKWFFLRLIYKIIYAKSQIYIAVSDGVKQNLHTIIGKDKNIINLYNPVLFNVINKKIYFELKPIENSVSFCVLGRLSYQKGFDIILEAFGEVKKSGFNNFELHIAGSGEELNNLKRIVLENDLYKNVYFYGFTTKQKDFYSNKDIFLFPSRYEGLGLSLIEAMNYGLPVISSNCEFGPSEILKEGKLGILIDDYKNKFSWCNIFIKILSKNKFTFYCDYFDSLSRFSVSKYVSSLHKI